KKVKALLMYLKGSSDRDYLLCKFQLNTGLRISAILDNISIKSMSLKKNFLYNAIYQIFVILLPIITVPSI
ncbi:hypothetical protein P5E48_15900, partial [Clostridium perfringens]|nr:hypothetical protein [Clostridium perfringens]